MVIEEFPLILCALCTLLVLYMYTLDLLPGDREGSGCVCRGTSCGVGGGLARSGRPLCLSEVLDCVCPRGHQEWTKGKMHTCIL